MKIKVERSGGFAGISTSSQVDTKDLPPKMVNTIKKISTGERSPKMPNKVIQKGAADHYAYKIIVENGASTKIIECNELNVHDDLKSLIKYMEKHDKKSNNDI